jgi:serine protease Do
MNRYLMRAFMMAAFVASLGASPVWPEPPAAPAGKARGGQPVVSRMPADALAQLSESLQQLARKVSPAVVQIEVTGFGPAEDHEAREAAVIVRRHTTGAGVILDPNGYIMTNAHVVEGAQRIRVMISPPGAGSTDESLAGRFRALDAQVIGTEKLADLALLKIEASDLPALPLSLHHPPEPGQLVFAIGSPKGLRNSVTMGVISSAWRQPDLNNPMVYVQTDAPINPGNSGGPLVDVAGDVVGLNTFIVSRGGGSEGLGFAVPARIVDFVYQSLKKSGHVEHIEIGVVAQTITPAMAEGLGLAQDWGVVIADVLPGGPAAAAGLRSGDVILAVDGYPMLSLIGFTAALYQHPSHQIMEVDVLRGGQKLPFQVSGFLVLNRGERFADVADPTKSRVDRLGILGLDVDLKLRSLLPDIRMGTGVIVLGHAWGFDSIETDLQPGDIIHELNRRSIESVEQLKAAVALLNPGESVVLRIERGGQFQYVAFEME